MPSGMGAAAKTPTPAPGTDLASSEGCAKPFADASRRGASQEASGACRSPSAESDRANKQDEGGSGDDAEAYDRRGGCDAPADPDDPRRGRVVVVAGAPPNEEEKCTRRERGAEARRAARARRALVVRASRPGARGARGDRHARDRRFAHAVNPTISRSIFTRMRPSLSRCAIVRRSAWCRDASKHRRISAWISRFASGGARYDARSAVRIKERT